MITLSAEFCGRQRLCILSNTSDALIIGTDRHTEKSGLLRLIKIYRQHSPAGTIKIVSLPEEELMIRISGIRESESETKNRGIKKNGFQINRIESSAPIITALNSMLVEAGRKRASDMHLEIGPSGMEVRFRIDGVLCHAHQFPAAEGRAIISRLKLMSSLNVMENRRPQEGRFSIMNSDLQADIRVSITATINGESVALRFLETNRGGLSVDELGFDESHLEILRSVPQLPSGLVLVTGPTGCGKTTTIAALIRACNTLERKIISLEDPVEYSLPGVTRIQIKEETGLGFPDMLARVLRQDPDILMIGEIRDTETAALAVQAALTGHLVLSTLHTASAAGALRRLTELGVEECLCRSVLHTVIAQRLVRRPCSHCSGEGCPECNGTGFLGRLPVAECISRGENRGIALIDDIAKKVTSCKTVQSEIDRVYGVPLEK